MNTSEDEFYNSLEKSFFSMHEICFSKNQIMIRSFLKWAEENNLFNILYNSALIEEVLEMSDQPYLKLLFKRNLITEEQLSIFLK